MKLLDANVVMYAQGRSSRFREPCRAILRQADADPGAYAIDAEMLQELLDVYTRRGERDEAVATVDDLLAVFPDPFPISRAEIEQAGELLRTYRELTPRDALHAAVVLIHDLEGIVSADDDFDPVSGLTRFDPLKLAGG